MFPAMIYVWFRRFEENLSKLLATLLFLASLFLYIVVPTRISTLQPLTCHIIYFLNARPYLGYETEILLGDMVCSESDEESMRNPNDVSISPCAYLRKYRVLRQLAFLSRAVGELVRRNLRNAP